MLLKGREAQKFTLRPQKTVWAALLFGDDEGLVADAGRQLAAAWDRDAIVTGLDEEAVRKDPASLDEALEAVSLLGEARIIRLRTNGDKLAALLVDLIQAGEAQPDRFAARLIIESGALPPRSKLRGAAEAAKRTAALQLFSETDKDVGERVSEALRQAGARITPPALAAFCEGLSGHRAIANMEIEKLSLYAIGLDRPIGIEDVDALSVTGASASVGSAVAAALDGRAADAQSALEKIFAAGTGGITVLRALQSETLRMVAAQEKISAGDPSPGKSLRPPVWPSEWPAYAERLRRWPARRSLRILARIEAAERQAKRLPGTDTETVRILMSEIARAASPR
jgi:DNA polymerase-3 subunit delta